MSWVKLSDDFWMHPKVVTIGDSAAGLYTRLLSYCGCYLTDGLVPAAMAEMIVAKNKRGLELLEEQGMVQRLESGGVLIRDYLEYNPCKEDVEAAQRKRQEAGRKGGNAKANAKRGLHRVV